MKVHIGHSVASTLVDVSIIGVQIYDSTATFKQAQKNNFIDVFCPVDLSQPMDKDVQFSKNFFGDLTDPGPDLGDCNAATNNAVGVDLFFSPSTKPNQVKYKAQN